MITLIYYIVSAVVVVVLMCSVRCISNTLSVMISLTVGLTGYAMLLIKAGDTVILWTGVALSAIGSCLWANVNSFTSEVMDVTPAIGCLLYVASCLGSIAVPALISALMQRYPLVLVITATTWTLVSILAFLLMLLLIVLRRRHRQENSGKQQRMSLVPSINGRASLPDILLPHSFLTIECDHL